MNNLKERRNELGLTQPEVSRFLKKVDPRIDVAMVSRFEQGVCLPTEDVLKALERVLQAPRSELYGELTLQAIPNKKRELSQYTKLVAEAVPHGRENAITREALAERMGMSDRRMRQAIEDARRDGLVICNESNNRGYYQSDEIPDLIKQYRSNRNRAMSILSQQKPLRDRILAAGGQI